MSPALLSIAFHHVPCKHDNGGGGRKVTSEPSTTWEMQPCIPRVLVLELGLWGNCGKALPCTLPHLPAGMFPGGRELRKDERGAPGMAGMQTNNEPGKRWARILCADGGSVKYGNKITQPSSLLGRRWLIRCLHVGPITTGSLHPWIVSLSHKLGSMSSNTAIS